VAKNRLVSAAVCLLTTGLFAGAVEASPAAMSVASSSTTPSASSSGWWEFWKSSPTSAPSIYSNNPPTLANTQATQVSPMWHPIDYVSAKWHGNAPVHPTASATPAYHDSIALSNPAGPPTPELYIAMAQIAERQGNVPEARHNLQHAVTMWPNNVELLRAAARMEDRVGNLPVAEALYQRAVAANPQLPGALNDYGLCLAREGKLDQSVHTLEQAVFLQPDKALYRNNAATVLVEMRQDQRALAHLSAVHAPAEANYNLGQLLVERNRPQDAAKYFQTALSIDPAMQPAQAALAQLNGAAPSQQTAAFTQNASAQRPAEITPVGTQTVPQQSVSQPSFPETARAPIVGQSTALPPAGSYGNPGVAPSAVGAAPTIRTAAAPHYLPPTAPLGSGTAIR
jgi:tetratricopeptide (TPR) repeat protein